MSASYRTIARDGIWDNNIVFAQTLGMCPTMAVTGSATNGLGMGLATTAVLVVANMMVSSVRNHVSSDVRIPVFIVLIAGLVTVVDMGINAYMHDLYKVLGLYIALIVANCAILGRAEAFASRSPILASGMDGLAMGLGFTFALTLVGAVREVLGAGTLFANAHLLLGNAFTFLELRAIPDYKGFLLTILPPGGFLVLGFLIAAKRIVDQRFQERRATALPSDAAQSPA